MLSATSAGGKPARLGWQVSDAREIEILSRCCRVWVDPDTLDPEAVQLAETVIKVRVCGH